MDNFHERARSLGVTAKDLKAFLAHPCWKLIQFGMESRVNALLEHLSSEPIAHMKTEELANFFISMRSQIATMRSLLEYPHRLQRDLETTEDQNE